MKNAYLRHFRELKCSKDILDIVAPINNKDKEITESLALIKKIKCLILKNPGKYTVIDMCAGNALTSIMAAFLLPVKEAIAIDIKPVVRQKHSLVRNWKYLQKDIYEIGSLREVVDSDLIVIASHSCYDLARRVFELGTGSFTAVMPCCVGTFRSCLGNIDFMDKHTAWAVELATEYKKKIIRDVNVLSPRNYVVYG